MCGIAGRINGSVENMLKAITHRGPDGSGIVPHENVEIGAVRLSIIDLEGSDQPINSSRASLVFNGEIFNYRHLRKKFQYSYGTNGDGEVILAMYSASEGNLRNFAEYLKEIEGFFAFAILDKSRKRLILARDFPGVKPLYIYIDNGKIMGFSSEIKAMLGAFSFEGIEYNVLEQYSKFSFRIAGPATPFKGVFSIPPGELLVVDFTGRILLRHRFYTPKDLPEVSFSDPLKALDTLLTKAVKSRIVADVPVALAFSAGMDSTALLIKLVELSKKTDMEINLFSVISEEFGFPKERFEEVLALVDSGDVGIKFYTAELKEKDLSSFDPFLAVEEPILNPTSPITWKVAEKAHKKGFKVLLFGEGSDEIFAGYTSHFLSALPQPVVCRIFVHLAYEKSPLRALKAILFPEFKLERAEDSLKAIQLFELEKELPRYQLLRLDKIVMAFSVEAREPFLYKPLISFGLSLPKDLKCSFPLRKKILVEYLRRKLGFAPKKNAPSDPLQIFLEKNSLTKRKAAKAIIERFLRKYYLDESTGIL